MIEKLTTLLAIVVLLAFPCIVFADQPVPATPETQGLVTSTGADVVGMMTEMDVGTLTLTSGPKIYMYTSNSEWTLIAGPDANLPAWVAGIEAAGGRVEYKTISQSLMTGLTLLYVPESLLDQQIPGLGGTATNRQLGEIMAAGPGGNPLIVGTQGIQPGTLKPGNIQYTTAYDANILAHAGHTVLSKSMNINTGNTVAATQSNLKASTLLTYIATADGGNVVGSENLLIDGAGNFTPASDRMLCPFAGGNDTIIPAYCNIVQAGSAYELTAGSVTTAANDRFVGTDATVPVALNYNINVKPYDTTSGSIPAMGSVSAYIKSHIQEARGQTAYNITETTEGVPYNYTLYPSPAKVKDLQYSEATSASGVISTFSKSMSYSSQATSTPLKVIPVSIVHADGG